MSGYRQQQVLKMVNEIGSVNVMMISHRLSIRHQDSWTLLERMERNKMLLYEDGSWKAVTPTGSRWHQWDIPYGTLSTICPQNRTRRRRMIKLL